MVGNDYIHMFTAMVFEREGSLPGKKSPLLPANSVMYIILSGQMFFDILNLIISIDCRRIIFKFCLVAMY